MLYSPLLCSPKHRFIFFMGRKVFFFLTEAYGKTQNTQEPQDSSVSARNRQVKIIMVKISIYVSMQLSDNAWDSRIIYLSSQPVPRVLSHFATGILS